MPIFMKVKGLAGVWLRYLPLLLIFFSVVLFLLLFQAQEKEQQYQLSIAKYENIAHYLTKMQHSFKQEAYGEVILQQEYGLQAIQETDTYIQENNLVAAGFENWKKQLYELYAPGNISRDIQKNSPQELLNKLSLCQKLHDEMLAYYTAKARQERRFINWSLGFGLLGFAAALILLYVFFTHKLFRPLEKLKHQTAGLMSNNSSSVINPEDFHTLLKPLALNIDCYYKQVNELRLITEQIATGNFQQDTESLKNSGAFAEAIIQMREKLKASAEAEKKRSWSSRGMDDFSRLLRHQHDTDLECLCKKVISALVPFIGANQGGLFLHHEEEQEAALVLKAAFAWGRQKYIKKTYRRGEGLIGQLALDHEMVLLTDVPDNFISIGSGLGHAKPTCIILLPLVANDSFQGVLELASFRCFQQHEINFLQNLSESIAAVLFRLRINEHTEQLLEKANESNMHLRRQEEELRQNTEELISTQEEMLRKETELKSLFHSIDNALLMCELDPDGKEQGSIVNINRKFASFFLLREEECLQRRFFQLMEIPQWEELDYQQLWQELKAGNSSTHECRSRLAEDQWISASFSPVLTSQGTVKKIIMLASDISEKKQAELEFISQAEEIMQQEETLRNFTGELEKLQQELEEQIREMSEEKAKNMAILDGCVDGVVSFNERGQVEFFNASAEEIWKISAAEAKGKKIQSLIPVEIQQKDQELNIYYHKNGQRKELDMRTEVLVQEATGNEVEVLLTLTKVKVNGSYTFTAFAQKVAVELF
jgi:PAS domain S-box-containing protein